MQCSIIDADGIIHTAELREPGLLFPLDQPSAQTQTIPPGGEYDIDLDVVLPNHRDQIIREAHNDEEKGAFSVKEAPLPIFCSGYYAYTTNYAAAVQAMQTWAIQKTFGVYLRFNVDTNSYDYQFKIIPLRFVYGPAGRTDWKDPTTLLSPTSSLDDILDAIDASGSDLTDFSADISMQQTSLTAGDTKTASGTILLQRRPDGNGRSFVHLDKQIADGKETEINNTLSLDNQTFLERDYLAKKEIAYTFNNPSAGLFTLGKGPFPLPVGQKKDDIKSSFDAKKIDQEQHDPPDTVHVQFTPKPQSQLEKKFKTIDLWINTDCVMPRRITTTSSDGAAIVQYDLTNLKINSGLSDSDFIQPPISSDWDQRKQPLP